MKREFDFSCFVDDKSDSDSEDVRKYRAISRRDELKNPYWMESPELGNGPVRLMERSETLFFQVRHFCRKKPYK